jgi:tRNA 2-thiouridine synthesizing protein E
MSMSNVAAQIHETDCLALLARDEEGFLLDAHDWHSGLIEPLAAESGLPLTEERRAIIRYIRDYFETNQCVPEARVVLKHMQQHWGRDRATRRYLYQLFPRGYGQQACKIAGMRKPRKLMLDV